MKNDQGKEPEDKVSMGLSLFIALCIVSVFCILSIAIVENIDSAAIKSKHVNLQNNKEFTNFI